MEGDELAIQREDEERLRFELECLKNANELYQDDIERLERDLAEARAALRRIEKRVTDDGWQIMDGAAVVGAIRQILREHADAIAKARAAEEG